MSKLEDLIARRVPRSAVVPGRAYVIHARNGRVGVAALVHGHLCYRLRREKFGQVFLDDEIDWADDGRYGTAIPLRLVDEAPPTEAGGLLTWLAQREAEAEVVD